MTTNTEDTLTDAELIEWLDDPKGMATSPITRAEARVICHQAAARIRSLQGEVEDCKKRLGDPHAKSPAHAYWRMRVEQQKQVIEDFQDGTHPTVHNLKYQLSEARELLERASNTTMDTAILDDIDAFVSRTPTHEQEKV